MTTWITLLRRAIVSVLLAVVAVLLLAAPGSAHAELVQTTPANGQRLETAPAQVTLAFSESVNLLEDGISLLDSHGATVSTPDPSVDGHTVTWPMPKHLRNGPYVVTWRVISADGHPVEGAFSFGVGAAAPAVGRGSRRPRARPRPHPGRWCGLVWSATSRSLSSPASSRSWSGVLWPRRPTPPSSV